MIISQKHKLCFLHNPKVAGTSIRTLLKEYHDYPVNFWRLGILKERGRTYNLPHLPYDDLPESIKNTIEDHFAFGFVRDPLSRFKSSYREFYDIFKDSWNIASLDVNDFVKFMLTPMNLRFDWRFSHFCPQHYFFYSGDELQADFIGKYESLKEDLLKVQELVGFDFGAQNVPAMNTKDEESDLNLSLDSLATLQKVYKKDFELFGYEWIVRPDVVPVEGYESWEDGIPVLSFDSGTPVLEQRTSK